MMPFRVLRRVPALVPWVVPCLFRGKTKEPECLDFKGFQAPKEQGMRESNSHQRFWRPLSYHLTNPLYYWNNCKFICNKMNYSRYAEICQAEMEGFEPSHRLPDLPHFECGPFSHLGTSPCPENCLKHIHYISSLSKGQFFFLLTWNESYNMI